MPIKIDDNVMCLEINGTVLGTARKRTDGWCGACHWPRFVDRDQAITALTATEILDGGRDSHDLAVRALREELR